MGKLILGTITIADTGSGGDVTKAYVDSEISRVEGEIPSLEGYATEEWVEDKGYLTEHQSLKTINNQSILGTGNITIEGGEGPVHYEWDLYYNVDEETDEETMYPMPTWAQAQQAAQDLDDHKVILVDFINEDEFSLYGYRLSDYFYDEENNNYDFYLNNGESFVHAYVKIEEGETVNGGDIQHYVGDGDISYLADEITNLNEYVNSEISRVEAEIPDITGYATESWVESQGYLTQHQSLSGYATESWVNNQGFLTSHQTLKTINNQSIVGSGNITITGDVTKSYVDQEIARVESEIPSLTGYATESWVESQGYLTQHQSLSGYATESWVTGQGYLTSHQSLSGYATESWVNNQGFLTSHQTLKTINNQSIVGTGNITISGGDVTKSYVDGEIARVESEIPSLTGYATESWVNNQGFLTQHQSLSNYTTWDAFDAWNMTVDSGGNVKCLNNFSPSDTSRQDLNFASLGTVRNFYNNLKGYTDTELSNKFNSSSVWTGTQAQWDALTSAQKASYTIALIR